MDGWVDFICWLSYAPTEQTVISDECVHDDTHTRMYMSFDVHSYQCGEEGVPSARETPGSILSPSLFSPPPPPSVLQARVMRLSPDSWHVNEDVMRLADMQLIWFPSLPCDDAFIKGQDAHK